MAHPFQYQSRPQVALPKQGDLRAVHHRQELMRRLNSLLNQGAIQQGKVTFLLKLPSIGTLAQRNETRLKLVKLTLPTTSKIVENSVTNNLACCLRNYPLVQVGSVQ